MQKLAAPPWVVPSNTKYNYEEDAEISNAEQGREHAKEHVQI